MSTIKVEIGFDLYKELTLLRETPDVTYDQVIRELLKNKKYGNKKKEDSESKSPSESSDNGWFYGKVFFPEGTQFRAFYKGDKYVGEVNNGALSLNGKRFDSPSGAAMSITETQVNGWKFWECKRPNDITWSSIDSLRNHR